MSRIFLSHSSHNDAEACALRDWLAEHGWDDVFLDLDPRRGLAAGQRWQDELKRAADRCEAVVFVITPAWAISKFCQVEFSLARMLGKHVFGAIVEAVDFDQLPIEMTAEFQVADLSAAGDAELRTTSVPRQDAPTEVRFNKTGLERLRIGLEKAGLDARTFKLDLSRPRYPGLRALDTGDAAIFFGRDADIVRGMDLIRRMRESGKGILVVLGASGSGKSSFVRAGLWPRLQRADREFFALPVMRPENAALEGPQGLIACLTSAAEALSARKNRAYWRDALRKSGGLTTTLRELIPTEADASIRLPVLIIDQAEELFHSDAGAEAAELLERLAEALSHGALMVIAATRSEAYERLQAARSLQGIEQVLYSLPPIPEGAVKELIEGPARREVEVLGAKALQIDPALTERLMRDWAGSDALPLLAFTLERLVQDYGGDGRIDLGEYESSHGLAGAIEAAVDEALSKVAGGQADREDLVRTAFIPRLVRIDPQSRAAQRKVATFDQLPSTTHALIERLVDARLLTSDSAAVDGRETRVVEVAHEALLRQWPLLDRIIDDERASLSALEDVRRDAAAWSAAARSADSLLHRGSRLTFVESLLARDDFQAALGAEGRGYLSACRQRDSDDADRLRAQQAREREQIAATRRAQRRATVLLTAVAVLIAAAAAALIKVTRAVGHSRSDALAALASNAYDAHQYDRAVRFALAGMARRDAPLIGFDASAAELQLGRACQRSSLRLRFNGQTNGTFSHDGKRVLIIGEDNIVRIWDATSGRSLARLKGHTESINTAVFSPDDKHVLTSSNDRTARVWDAGNGREFARLGHQHFVNEATFNHDATRVVTTSDDTVRVWNLSDRRQIALIATPLARDTNVTFNNDGTRLMTADAAGHVHTWDPASGRELMKMALPLHEWLAAFSDDGTRIVTASSDHAARIRDSATGRELQKLKGHEADVSRAALSHDGTRVLTTSKDGTTRVWDAATGRELAELARYQDWLRFGPFSNDGSLVMTASLDGTVWIWDATTGREIARFEGHQGDVDSATFNRDGTRVVTASEEKCVRIWDVKSSHELMKLAAGSEDEPLNAAFFNRQGTQVVTAYYKRPARVWDATSGHEVTSLEPSYPAITRLSRGRNQVRDAADFRERADLEAHKATIADMAPDKNGTRVVTTAYDRDAAIYDGAIWDEATMRELVRLKGHEKDVMSAAFNHAGTQVVTGSLDRTALIWDAASGRPVKKLVGHTNSVFDVAFSDDDTRVVTASEDHTARIWDVTSGKPLRELDHDSAVWTATFNHEGTRVVTASYDQTARIWDTATGRELARLEGHRDSVDSAFFDHDGKRVVTASHDGTARIWDTRFVAAMHGDELVKAACHEVLSVDSAATSSPNDLSRFSPDELQLAPVLDANSDGDACRPATSWEHVKAMFGWHH